MCAYFYALSAYFYECLVKNSDVVSEIPFSLCSSLIEKKVPASSDRF